MGRYNKGLVSTNENCIACNKCIAHCPIPGANVCVGSGIKRAVHVDAKKCTHCGNCVAVCPHDAREYRDDFDELVLALSAGTEISVIIDPSFYMYYGEVAFHVLGYLKSLGVKHLYNAGFGAEISIWAHTKYIKDHENLPKSERAFIINSCPSVVDAIELYHPSLINKMIPVHSPSMCTAIYVKKYLKDESNLAYIGPCISKKDEFATTYQYAEVRYYVTYRHMMSKLKTIDINSYYAETELESVGMGDLISVEGAFADGIGLFFPVSARIDKVSDMSSSIFDRLEDTTKPGYEIMQPLAAEINACRGGCIEGHGTNRKDYQPIEIYNRYAKARLNNYDKNEEKVDSDFVWIKVNKICTEVYGLNYEDFERSYVDRYKQPFTIPQSTYKEIYAGMLKDTPLKQNINCGSCGYNTCHEMASAIAYGYNHKENCIHYMNDMMTQRYTFDPITDLYSTQEFMRLATDLVTKNKDKKYFVCLGNVNKLQVVNDVYGYENGNIVLKIIAFQLLTFVGNEGVCGYMGNGNFVLCMEYQPGVIERLQNNTVFDMSDFGIQQIVTARFGIYIVENRAEDMYNMVNYAAMASKQNVSTIQNTFSFFSNETRKRISEEAELVAHIQKAIENNEFSVLFSPIYDISDRSIVGAQGVCYWEDGEGRVYQNAEFMPIARKNGLIKAIDNLLWRKSFEVIRRWLEAGLEPPPVTLKMSGLSLMADDTMETLEKLRDEFSVSNHYIKFEISEADFEGNIGDFAKRVAYLKKMGYHIVMGDFGGGKATYTTLKEMPIDCIKINMQFFQDEDNRDRAGSIVASVSRMAQDIGIEAMAANVDTEVEANFLRSIGILTGTGSLFSAPLKEHEYTDVLKETKYTIKIERMISEAKLDVARFFDPSSDESIMFESFCGPAGLAEYDNTTGYMEIIRVNAKAANMLGCESKSLSELQSIFSGFLKERGIGYIDTVKRAIISKHEESCLINVYEQRNRAEKWINVTMTVINQNDDRYMFYFLFENVTGEEIIDSAIELSNHQMAYMMEAPICGNCLIHVKVNGENLRGAIKMTVIKANEEFTKLTGFTRTEVAGWTEKELIGVIHPLDQRSINEGIYQNFIVDKKKSYAHILRCQHRSGYYKKVNAVITVVPLEDDSYMASINIVSAEGE